MRRGFNRFRKKEYFVKEILDKDTTVQSIGLLAQRVVWEFYKNPSLLERDDAIEIISARIELETIKKSTKSRLSNY